MCFAEVCTWRGYTALFRHTFPATASCSNIRGCLMSACNALNQDALASQHLEVIESPQSQTQKWFSSHKAVALCSHAACSSEDLKAL